MICTDNLKTGGNGPPKPFSSVTNEVITVILLFLNTFVTYSYSELQAYFQYSSKLIIIYAYTGDWGYFGRRG